MKITIIFDNDVWQEGLKAAWGFSCLVEAYGKKILFDTGGNGTILLENMKKLNIEPTMIDMIFISHNHGDHTGGLVDVLRVNQTKVYIPYSFSTQITGTEIIRVKNPIKIHENIFSTGELKNIEQSLLIKIKTGLVVIVGCSHPGVKNILDVASQFDEVTALIGGLHGFHNFNLIKNLHYICPAHCTRYKSEIQKLYPSKFVSGGVGRIIEIS